jgi:hypothetical protein
MLRFRVEGPTVQPVPHGLLDVAEIVQRDDPHWRTGIEYDSVACSTARLWGRWCTAAGMPAVLPDTSTIALALTGQLAAGRYSMLGAAGDNAADRQISFKYYDDGVPRETVYLTGTAPVEIAADDEPLNGHLVITDVLTGTHIEFNIVQNAATGDIENPGQEALLFRVPQAAVPEGCESISTAFVASAAADPATGVDIVVTTTGETGSERMVTIAGHRLILQAGDASATLNIPTGVGEGTWPISVHDVDSSSFVSGWIYISDTLAGQATLLQATCPVKEIRSAPWTTLFAPAWTVYAEVQCQTLGFEDAAAAASDVLALAEAKAIEAAWWDLAFDRARALGTGLSVTAAVAELEHYIATNYAGLGLIHVPAYLAAWFGLDRTAREDASGVLRTLRGTPVVIGAGYPRQADGEGAGVALMATGAVRLYTSDVDVIEVLDRRTNLRAAVAERTIAAADDCLEPAVAYIDVAVAR